jgi:hypothetical protein
MHILLSNLSLVNLRFFCQSSANFEIYVLFVLHYVESIFIYNAQLYTFSSSLISSFVLWSYTSWIVNSSLIITLVSDLRLLSSCTLSSCIKNISLNGSVPVPRWKDGKTPMQLGLSETAAVLSHQAYDDMTSDSVNKRHVQWNVRIGDVTDGGHFEYLL